MYSNQLAFDHCHGHEFESNFGQVLSKHSEKNMRVKLLSRADGTIGGKGDFGNNISKTFSFNMTIPPTPFGLLDLPTALLSCAVSYGVIDKCFDAKI